MGISHCEDSYPSTLEVFSGDNKASFSWLRLIPLLRTSDSLGEAQHKRKMLTWEASILFHGNCFNLQCISALQGTANTVEWVQSQGRGWMGDFHDIAQEPNLVLPAWWVNIVAMTRLSKLSPRHTVLSHYHLRAQETRGWWHTVFPPAAPQDSCFEQRVKETDRPKQKTETCPRETRGDLQTTPENLKRESDCLFVPNVVFSIVP